MSRVAYLSLLAAITSFALAPSAVLADSTSGNKTGFTTTTTTTSTTGQGGSTNTCNDNPGCTTTTTTQNNGGNNGWHHHRAERHGGPDGRRELPSSDAVHDP